MTSESACACPHRCDPPCTSCLAGWHRSVCPAFTTKRVNMRTIGLPDSACGLCGSTEEEHRR